MDALLLHIINPLFQDKGALFCFVNNSEIMISEYFPKNLTGQRLITHDANLLLSYLRENNLEYFEAITDISDVYQLLIGQPSKYFDTLPPWSFWRLISSSSNFEHIDYLYKISNGFSGDPINMDNKVLTQNLKLAMHEFLDIYKNAIVGLKNKQEYIRFCEVEIPVADVFHRRCFLGIKISSKKIADHLDNLDRDIAASSNILRKEWKIIDPKQDQCIIDVISSMACFKNLKIDDYFNLSSILDMDIDFNPMLTHLGVYRRAVRDKNILLRLGCLKSERLYPDFFPVGTITGRILVKNPPIQNLGRKYRNVIIPDDGFVLMYPDYSAFEPGILASESGDKNLIALYNNADLYSEFSSYIFGENRHRTEAKRLFLSYMFGMNIEKLSFIASQFCGKDFDEMRQSVLNFLEKFSVMNSYVQSVSEELLKAGRIGTVLGNFRYLKNKNNTRWALSQRIQGTASYILKEAIVRLSKISRDIDFLLPMHDAVLIQVPDSECQRYEQIVLETMKTTFSTVCPMIKPKVKLENWGF